TSVTFSPDGRWLASAGEDQTVKLWEVGSGVTWKKTLRHPAGVSVAFADESRLVSVGQDGRVRIWDTADTDQELLTLTRTQPNARSPGVQVGFNPDPNRRQVAVAFKDGIIEIRDWAPEEGLAGNP